MDGKYPLIEVGGISIPLPSSEKLIHAYERVQGGQTLRRTQGGAAVRQIQWQKMRVTIRGGGRQPIGLKDLDLQSSVTLKCGVPRMVLGSGTSNIITVTSERRSDTGYDPVGLSFVGRGIQITPISWDGNEATLTTVTGAQQYAVKYYPQITALIELSEDLDERPGKISWTLTAEQV